MKKIIVVLVLLAIGLMSMPTSAQDNTEQYRGAMGATLEIQISTIEDFTSVTSNYTGSSDDVMTIVQTAGVWNYLYEYVRGVEAPEEFEAYHTHMVAAYEHMSNAGNYMIIAVSTDDASYVQLAITEMEKATERTEQATEEMNKIRG